MHVTKQLFGEFCRLSRERNSMKFAYWFAVVRLMMVVAFFGLLLCASWRSLLVVCCLLFVVRSLLVSFDRQWNAQAYVPAQQATLML